MHQRPRVGEPFKLTTILRGLRRTGKSLETLAKEFVMANRPSPVIQRAATVEEVANMVVYVCSTQASATSGAALRVDGGVVDDIV